MLPRSRSRYKYSSPGFPPFNRLSLETVIHGAYNLLPSNISQLETVWLVPPRERILIVQCEHCQTKYRIPDEKVKGKGVKVRCTKCNKIFTVLPAGEIPAPASAPPKSGPAAPEAVAPKGEPSPPSTSKPLPEQAEAPSIPTPSKAPLSEESEISDETPTPDADKDLPEPSAGTYESDAFQEDAAADRAHRPAHEIDRGPPAAPSSEDVPVPELSEFEIETTAREDTSEPPESSTDLLEDDLPDTSLPVDEETGWGNISLGAEPDQRLSEEGIDLAGSNESQSPPPPPSTMDEELLGSSESEQFPDPMEERTPVPAYQPESTGSRKWRKGFLLLLVLVLLGTGGYFAYPKIMDIISSQREQTGGTLTPDPDSIQVKSLTRQDGKFVYTVRGEIRNNSQSGVGMIQVEAQFRNTSGEIVATSNAYCGNIFDDAQIITGDLEKLRSDLQNELGQSLSNSGIQPEQSIPFLIVLEDPPAGISNVTVSISAFKETT